MEKQLTTDQFDDDIIEQDDSADLLDDDIEEQDDSIDQEQLDDSAQDGIIDPFDLPTQQTVPEIIDPFDIKADLAKSAIVAHNVNPDQWAENRKQAEQQGIPKILANPANTTPDVKTLNNTIQDFQGLSGKTAQHMTDPEFASLAKDDTQNLSFIERVYTEYGKKPLARLFNKTGLMVDMLAFPFAEIADAISGGNDYKDLLVKRVNQFEKQLQLAQPDPNTSLAGHVIQSLEELIPLFATGPLTIPLIVGQATTEKGLQLAEAGVGSGKTAALSALAGLTAYGMTKIPLDSKTYIGAMAKGSVSFPVLGTAERGIEKGVLSLTADNEQEKNLAESIDVLDKKALAFDIAMGILFGGYHKYQAAKMQAMLEAAQESKLSERDEELFKVFIKEVAKEQEPLQMPLEKVDEILASKNVPPEKFFDDPQRYYEAKFNDTPVDIPVQDLAAAANHVKPEHINDIRTKSMPSVNEVEAQKLKTKPTQPQEEVSMGEQAPNKLAERLINRAIEEGVLDESVEVPTHDVMKMKELGQRVRELVESDPQRAFRIAQGIEPAPEDIPPTAVWKAISSVFFHKYTVDEIRQLAFESTIPEMATKYGQFIKAADVFRGHDPLRDIREISNIRKERGKLQKGEKAVDAQELKKVKKELEEVKTRLSEYMTKTKNPPQKVYGSRNKLVTKREYQKLKDEIRKQLGSQLNVGIDPTLIPKITKVGLYHLEAGLREFGAWSRQMIEDFGDAVKPHLNDIWESIKDKVPESQKTRAQNAQETRYKKLIKQLEEKLASGDFAPEERTKLELTEEGKKLYSEYKRLQQDYKNLLDISGTVTNEEISIIMELSNIRQETFKKYNEERFKTTGESGWDSIEDRINYGAADVLYKKFVEDLKTGDDTIKSTIMRRMAQFKEDYRQEGAYEATLHLVDDIITTIVSNSIGMVGTFDNSFMGRQGIKVLFLYPKQWLPGAKNSFADIVKTLGGENAKDALLADIYSRDNYINGSYRSAKILVEREEQFPTLLPERIPIIGRFYKASEAAFWGSGLRMRTDLYDFIAKRARENGVDMNDSTNVTNLGKLVGSLTARGQWGEKGDPWLMRVVLWAPKMLKANIDFLTAHSFHRRGGGLQNRFLKHEARMNLLKYVAELALIMAIADALFQDSVELDPRSAKFGKIFNFDITGGAASIVTLAARIITNSKKDYQTGLVTPYEQTFGKRSRLDAFLDFIFNKTSPPVRVVVDWLRGRDNDLEPFSWSKAAYKAFTPIPIQNALNLKDEQSADAIAAVILDFVGISSSYDSYNAVQRRDIVNRLRDGKQLTQAQNEYLTNLTQKQIIDIERDASMTAKECAFSNLTTNAMIRAWAELSDEDRMELQEIYDKRLNKARSKLSGEALEEFEQMVYAAEERK